MAFSPHAAKTVLQSPTTKSLLPLEITDKFRFGWELVEQLPPTYSRVGAVLEEIIPFFFRSTRQHLGLETVAFQAVLPILMLGEPMLLEWEQMAGDIETAGDLTRGATIFDRRAQRGWRDNMEVASKVDLRAAKDAFFNCLKYAAAH